MSRFVVAVACFALLAGCTREETCAENPDNRFCRAACEDDPTLPHCPNAPDAGPRADAGIDAAVRDAGPDRDATPDGGPGDAGPCGTCGGSLPYCLDDECVACRNDADCGEADLAACDATTHACVACTDDTSCSAEKGGPACNDGTCAACAVGRGADDCGGKVCNLDGTCSTTIDAGDADRCDPCTVSEECGDGEVCAYMEFVPPTGSPVAEGNRCLPLDTGGCTRGEYGYPRTTTTTEGETVDVCSPRTTCFALSTFGMSCVPPTGGVVCGLAGGVDGTCPEATRRCTYFCTSMQQCASTCTDNLCDE